MSAGVCGKRAGIEDIFGPGSPQSPAAKRSRCSSSDLGCGAEDKLSVLSRMFPSVNREVVQSVLDSNDSKLDDAIKTLHSLCLGNDPAAGDATSMNSAVLSENNVTLEGGTDNPSDGRTKVCTLNEDSEGARVLQNGTTWVDLFLQEMMHASGWDDIRCRTTRLLEAYEKSIIANSMTSHEQEEVASLKVQLECMLKENNILKKGIQIQHLRSLEQEQKLQEVPQLKHLISQCQEQIRKLEMDNYTLRVHLQRAQEPRSISNHYNRDIF